MLLGQANKTKMPKNPLSFSRFFIIVISIFICAVPVASADVYQQQIDALSAQNTQAQNNVDALANQASSYQAEINLLQGQINALQNAIIINQNKQTQLQQQIDQDNTQIAQEKQVLGNAIRTMYVNGQISTLEMLASSKSLSDFVDAETYRSAVSNEIQSLVTQIQALEVQLKQESTQLTIVLNTQQQQENQLASSQTQQQQLLSYNQQQQDAYNQQIQSNQAQIATLRAEQIAANRKLVGSGYVDYSGTCGGSYPASASGPYGNWGCDYSLDNTIDNWGMYNRECVSYTAWMVYHTYGYMPYWGGSGDAREWPGDAQAAGIPTGSTPKVGSVAIYMGGYSDPWGHAMWVKSVNGDGTITVDQYNLYYDGNFYETTIPASGLVYIYFGG